MKMGLYGSLILPTQFICLENAKCIMTPCCGQKKKKEGGGVFNESFPLAPEGEMISKEDGDLISSC